MAVLHEARATIVRQGVPGMSEPYAEIEGRQGTMPMGHNRGQTLEVGMKGTARYVQLPGSGLWEFTPDDVGTT